MPLATLIFLAYLAAEHIDIGQPLQVPGRAGITQQEAAVALAKASDLMLVIGGRNSSNTKMLHDLCSRETRSLHIEDAGELTLPDLADAANIGLAAGASTPEEAILEVYNQIFKLMGIPGAVSRFEEIPRYKEESC